MPSRKHLPRRQEDPFRRIRDWNDGYDSRAGDEPSSPGNHGARSPLYTSPPPVPDPPREAWEWAKDEKHISRDADRRRRYPSPPSESDGYARRRRDPRTSSPSGARRGPDRARSPSPQRRRRPSLEARATAPTPRTRSFRDAPAHEWSSSSRPKSSYPRSPSPSPTRRRDGDRTPPRGFEAKQPTRRRRHRSPTPPPRHPRAARETTTDAKPRPPLTRSKTTTAAAGRDGPTSSSSSSSAFKLPDLTHLSPRWQRAAAAALQAGGMAALSARSQPGKWTGEKGARVAGAALGAAARDVFSSPASSSRGGGGDDRGRRERGNGRGRTRGRDGGGGRGGSDVAALGDVLSGFIVDRWAKGRSSRR